LIWSLGDGEAQTGRLRVWFDPINPNKATQVQLFLFDGISPSSLSRFPWKKYMSAAWSAKVAKSWPDQYNTMTLIDNLTAVRSGTPLPRTRPGVSRGRKALGLEFYQQVALDYYSSIERSPRSPVKLMATERGVSVAAVRSWIHTARKIGVMPPGTRGRPG